MADGKKKQPLSLNQLHSRFLTDLSASHSKPKSRPVNDDPQMKLKKLDKEFKYIEEENDDVPRFDSGSPSPPFQARETHESSKSAEDSDSASVINPSKSISYDSNATLPVAMNPKHVELESGNELGEKCNAPMNMSSLSVSASVANPSNSISFESHPTLPVAMKSKHVELESGNESEKKDTASKNISLLSGVGELDCDFPGQERRMKVRIEGRRRLCKITKNDDGDADVWQNLTKDDEQRFDAIADFYSPLEVKTTIESKGSEIRDILNDLSSRFEILSIEKKRVLKKVEVEDIQESERCKLYDLDTKDGFREYQTATSSTLFASDFPAQKIESEMGGTIINESQPFCSRRENIDYGADDCGLLSERNTIKQGDRRQQKFIELSDDESDEVTILGEHVDEFTLSGPRDTYRLPGKIAKMLYPHQREGLKWLWSLHCKGKGGILGDDMGLGKTMQICGYIAGLFHSNLIRRVLIVAPKTLLTHWINELSTVGLSLKTREYFSTCTKTRHYELQYILQDKGILLTTYDIVRNNAKSLCGVYHYRDDKEEDETIWDYMILDEGHLIKNPSTQRAKSLLQIPCLHRIIISGTPLQNNLKELWALFSFCCPDLLGDKKEFKEKYEHYINRGNEKNASDREKRIGSSIAKDLRDCIKPYFLRRLKSEVFRDDASLSKKNEIIVWLRLTQCQRQLYEAFLRSEIVISACDGSPLAAITILKKICDHPLLLTKRAAEDVLEGMDAGHQQDDRIAEKLAMHIADVAERFDIVENDEISCKLSFVLSLLGDLIPKGHNVLIFSQTRKMLNLIQESLISNQYKYMRIDGTTKISDRAKIVKDFQEGRGAPIFLLTSQVGGLGLTLTNADRVIVVDPAWNPSSDNQSVDRAYRIGQKKDVIVYRLMTCGTVEEKIYRKQVFKGGLFRSATEHKEQIRYFSQQDLKDLFSLPKQGFDISLTQQQLLEEHDQQDTIEESLRAHVAFLETLNVAGVSQHSLLFSKEAPLQAVEIEEDERRIKGSTFMGNASRLSPVEPNVDRSHFLFNPKDVKNIQKSSNFNARKPSETEIRDRINRLTQMFVNKVAISKLPDKGERIHKQIAALKHQLGQMGIEKQNKGDVIEL